MRATVRTTVAGAVLAVVASLPGSATATAPLDVTGPITDRVGALDDTAAVQRALDDLYDEHGIQLFVVFVDSFDGTDGAQWADQTAETSGLHDQDVLLAVATQERSYGLNASEAISESDLEDVRQDVLAPLRESDWDGAAITAAESIGDAVSSSALPWGLIGIGVVGVGAAGTVVYLGRRRRRGSVGTGDTTDAPSTDDLDQQASTALVDIDDALKTSDQELGFAQAQFGRQATAEFARILQDGRATVAEAFALRQRLDDADPETEPERRRMLQEILDICARVDAELDAQVDGFDHLRDLHERAPEVLADLGTRVAELRARIPASRATLTALRTRHRGTVLTSIAGNVDQAEHLLAGADTAIDAGRASLATAGEDRSVAVAHARAAEDAVGQTVTLLEAVDRADADLATAPDRIAARLTSLASDLDDVQRLAPTDPAVATAADAARAAIASARAPGHDPLAVATALDLAEARLDEVMDPIRAAAAEAEKTRRALDDALGRVQTQIAAVADFIETRRGAVGSQARTRISEAARLLSAAHDARADDPTTALSSAQRAEALATDAQRLAQQDVDAWERRRSGGTGSGGSMNSMILGGILIDALTRSGGNRSGGISFPGGGGAMAPGGFGGSRTRSRHGTGGRF